MKHTTAGTQQLLPLISLLGLCIFTVFPALSWAGGVALYEVTGGEVGLAGAGYAARAQDPGTVFTNPAGLPRLGNAQLLAGLRPLYGDTRFSPDEATSLLPGGDGGNAIGWVPGGQFFVTSPLGPDVSVGFGAFSYFGNGLDYGDDWVGRYYVQNVLLIGMTFMPSIGYHVNDWLSVGAGLNAMYGVFEEEVAIGRLLAPDGQLEISDGAWGFGGNFGVLLEPREGTRVGLNYLTRVNLDFSDVPEIRGFQGPVQSRRLDLQMEVPQMLMFSIFHDLNEYWAVMGNVGWQEWSQFGKVGLTVSGDPPTTGTFDRNYKDTWHAAIGAQYRVADPWLLSAGFAYDSSAVDDEDRTVDLPLGEGYRFGVGAKYDWNESLATGFAYELAWGGDLPLSQQEGLKAPISGEYRNTAVHFVSLDLTYRF